MSWIYSDAWAAGVFDGEGYVTIQKRLRGGFLEHQVYAQVGQQIPEPLQALANRFGGNVTTESRYANGLFWRWRVYGTIAESFLTAVFPHSLVKREEIAAALDLRACVGKPGTRSSLELFHQKECAYARWKDAKRNVKLRRSC